ncbi:MAG: hypothetical protein HYV45_02905 [Candidatus Moranbacteria bacterium]|nr:hypothetical protein [Candidatus Moranbacteria bacterium]
MKFFSKKQTVGLSIVGVCVLIGLVAWFGIKPLRQIISDKRDDIQKYYTSRENRDRQIKKLPELEKQYDEILAGKNTLDIMLTEDRIVTFVKTLEQLAKETNTEIIIEAKSDKAIIEKKIVASPDQPKKSSETREAIGEENTPSSTKKDVKNIIDNLPFHRYLHITVVVRGEYVDIVTLLHKIETLPFALDMLSVEMHHVDDEEESSGRPGRSFGDGVNPFIPFGSGESTVTDTPEQQAETKKRPPLEAAFEIAVYVDKK